MKIKKSFLVVLVIMALVIVFPLAASAANSASSSQNSNGDQISISSNAGGNKDKDKENNGNSNGNSNRNGEKNKNNGISGEEKQIKAEKQALEKEMEALQEEYQAAITNGDTELAAQIELQMGQLTQQITALEEQMAAIKTEEKAWIQTKNALEQEKDALEALKDQLELDIVALEAQYAAAEASGDTELMATLRAQLQTMEEQKTAYKAEIKQKIEQMKLVIKEQYTLEELNQLALTAQEMNGVDGVQVIAVENVILKNGKIKFDVPPVIKSGRTLLPLRAISEGLGAEVAYDSATNTVTIIKDGKEIVFLLDEDKVLVDGVETAIDVSGEVMNNRTMVPLRFIAETLEVDVEWDPDNQIIEIDPGTDPEPEQETEPVPEAETETE